MIFATVGTHEQPFDRLLRALDELETDERRVVQSGTTTLALARCEAEAYLPFERMRELMGQADVVVTHAGTGSVMLALSMGRVPVVAPRYRRHGEHVDDHQIQLVERLRDDGLVIPWLDGDPLGDRIAEARARGAGSRRVGPDPRLVAELERIVLGSARRAR